MEHKRTISTRISLTRAETIEFASSGGALVTPDIHARAEAYVSVSETRARMRNEGRGRYSERDTLCRGRFR